MVWEIFGCGVHSTGHARMPANTTETATEDEDNEAQRAQILSLAKSCVEDAAYPRITKHEEDERGDQEAVVGPSRRQFFPKMGRSCTHQLG